MSQGSPKVKRRHLTVGPPIDCDPADGPFKLETGQAEIYLQSEIGRMFLGAVGPGDCVFPNTGATGKMLLVITADAYVSPIDKARHGKMFDRWRRIATRNLSPEQSHRIVEIDDPATLNAALIEILLDAVEKDREAVLYRLRPQAKNDRQQVYNGENISEREDVRYIGGGQDPSPSLPQLLQYCADRLIVDAKTAPPTSALKFDELPEMASAYGLLARHVTLKPDWFLGDLGTLIVCNRKAGTYSAAVWGKAGYETHRGEPITAAMAADISSQAATIMLPLNSGKVRMRDLARFVLRESRSDFKNILLAALVVAVLGAVVPVITGWILSDIAPSGDMGLLVAIGAALIVSLFVQTALEIIQARASERIGGRVSLNLVSALYDRLLRLPARFFKSYTSGDLNQRLVNVESLSGMILSFVLSVGLSAILSVFYFAILIAYDPLMALVSLGLVSIFIIIVVLARLCQVSINRRAYALDGEMTELTYETIGGVAKLRTAAAEERALNRWVTKYQEERELNVKAGRIASVFEATAGGWSLFTTVVIFASAGLMTQFSLSPGIFISFLIAFGAFQGAILSFSNKLIEIYASQPEVERAKPLLDTVPEQSFGRSQPGKLSGRIDIQDLEFAYHAGQAPILRGISLSIVPGEHIAIVGSSGSGKSTLMRVLLGLETQNSGAVLYDGKDLKQVDVSAVRRQIGVVMQSSSLFAGAIIDNIRGARQATLEECLEAADKAGLAKDLEYFPMGMHTPITEGAAAISGGQRQRVLIARALLGNPKILFFDEATSALDNATQAQITQTLDSLSITRITIAHRLSTVRNADRICVLKDGVFIEDGSYDDLMELGGEFAALAKRQIN